jgi:hypothetical protein
MTTQKSTDKVTEVKIISIAVSEGNVIGLGENGLLYWYKTGQNWELTL